MLEIKNISLRIDDDKSSTREEILHDINLKLDAKKIYVITGPNGGGKSSLSKVLMGINKATTGEIKLDNVNITDMTITERAKIGVGYAFQTPPRFKGMKVKELLKIASKENPIEVDVQKLLLDVGLCPKDYIDREMDASLSGGEMKRIEIATILARNLKVAIFDEPEAGIDLWSFQRLAETFREMRENTDTTIIIVSHQERILNLADEVILLSEGRVKELTSKEKILCDIKQNEECSCNKVCSVGGESIC